MKLQRSVAALVAVLFVSVMAVAQSPEGGALTGERFRVIVSTDIGGSDPDDFQSMVHLLVYADVVDIEGLIASPPGKGRAQHLHESITTYEKDYPALKSHSSLYPAPTHLRGLVKQGAQLPSAKEGIGQATEGSNWIITCANVDDKRPLYVLVWGSITDVAQAVHDAPEIKQKLRVYSIASWNTKMDVHARNYLINNHKDLWWIECDTTFRGMYVGGNQKGDLGNTSFIAQHVKGHGALGAFFVSKKADIKMGDTPSLLYLLRGDPNNPETTHWGGRFVKTDQGPNYWTDDLDPALTEGPYRGANTVNQWREAYLRDWQQRMDRVLPQKKTALINENGWFVQGDAVIWGWVQHNGWWRPGERPNLTRRSVGDPQGDVRPNRTEDLDKLTDNMLRYGFPGFEQNYGLWYDRRRDAHDTTERTDPNVVPPFLEQPWARSKEGQASDGLPKYDLEQFNSWYFQRLRDFADLCDQKGTVLFHKYYMQHALLEGQMHYIDFPWRPKNCIQATDMPDKIPAANAFYDVSHPERRRLHRLYIRHCLNVLGDNRNVVHQISEEFTGPLHFVEFWMDCIAEWEAETGKQVTVALGAPKDAQDAILADTSRAAQVDVIDPRYWWIRKDGSLYAPDGGHELPGRGLERGSKQFAESSHERIYQKLRGLRDAYPDKAILDAIHGDRQACWAFLMAGGGMLVRGGITYPDKADPVEYIKPAEVDIILPTYSFIQEHLSETLPKMKPADCIANADSPTWALNSKNDLLIYALKGGTFSLNLPKENVHYTASWFDPRTGALTETSMPETKTPTFTAPDGQDWALWLRKK